MSVALDIVRDAIERGRRIADEHAQRVNEVAGELSQHVGRPWKFRMDWIRQRNEQAGRETTDNATPTGQDAQP